MELNYKLTSAKKTLDKVEELKAQMEFLEGGAIRELKDYLRSYIDAPDNDSSKS
jgi:hypothetical protein